MEKQLHHLIEELGDVINSALSDSDRFAAIMTEMEQAGYDVFVVLEASIGVRKNGESEFQSGEAAIQVAAQPRQEAVHDAEMTASDLDFLKELKISAA